MPLCPLCPVTLNGVTVDIYNIDKARIFDPWVSASQVFDALGIEGKDRDTALAGIKENQRKTKSRLVKTLPSEALLHPVAVVLLARTVFTEKAQFSDVCGRFYLELRNILQVVILPTLSARDQQRAAAMAGWLLKPGAGARH